VRETVQRLPRVEKHKGYQARENARREPNNLFWVASDWLKNNNNFLWLVRDSWESIWTLFRGLVQDALVSGIILVADVHSELHRMHVLVVHPGQVCWYDLIIDRIQYLLFIHPLTHYISHLKQIKTLLFTCHPLLASASFSNIQLSWPWKFACFSVM